MVERFKAMKWQDRIFATGEIVFMVGLIPSLVSPDKPSALTSFATAFMLYTFLFVHASYKLWVTFSLAAITATIWMILGIQALS